MDEKGLVWSIKERERERLPRNVIYIPDSMVLVLLFRWMEMRRVAILWLTSEGIRCVVRPFNTFETPFWLCQLLLRLNTRFLLRRKPSLKKIFFFFCSKDNKNGCQNAFNPGGGNGAKPFSHAGILERIERFLQVFISRIYFF